MTSQHISCSVYSLWIISFSRFFAKLLCVWEIIAELRDWTTPKPLFPLARAYASKYGALRQGVKADSSRGWMKNGDWLQSRRRRCLSLFFIPERSNRFTLHASDGKGLQAPAPAASEPVPFPCHKYRTKFRCLRPVLLAFPCLPRWKGVCSTEVVKKITARFS